MYEEKKKEKKTKKGNENVLPRNLSIPKITMKGKHKLLDVKELVMKIHPISSSPYCKTDNPFDCNHDHTLWPWALFASIVFTIGTIFLYLGGGITGKIHVSLVYSTSFVWFGWVAIISGVSFFAVWLVYFYGWIWKKEAMKEIQREENVEVI